MDTQTLIRLVLGLVMTGVVLVFAARRILWLTSLIRSGQPVSDERGRKDHLGTRITTQISAHSDPRRRGRATSISRRGRCGAAHERPGRTSRVRVPLGNAQFATALQEADIASHRTTGPGDPDHGRQDLGQGGGLGIRCARGSRRVTAGLTDADLIAGADEVGYPVLVKPSAGGGGKGMRLVHDPAALPAALASARREAAAAFGDDTLFLERFVVRTPATLKCRCSPTATAMSCTSVSANAACSGATRRSSRRRRHRCWMPRPAPASAPRHATPRAASITPAPDRRVHRLR